MGKSANFLQFGNTRYLTQVFRVTAPLGNNLRYDMSGVSDNRATTLDVVQFTWCSIAFMPLYYLLFVVVPLQSDLQLIRLLF